MYINKSNLENKIESKLDEENIYIKDILNKYNTFKDLLNNLQDKDIEKVYEFYNSGKNIIDFSTIYYYLKHEDLNNELYGAYPKNFKEISNHKGSREDKKTFKKKCKTYTIDHKGRLVKLKEIKDETGNMKIKELLCIPKI